MISYELFHIPLSSAICCRVQPLKGGCRFSPYPNTHHPSKDDEKGEALEAACHLMSDLAELLEGVYQGLGFFLLMGLDFLGVIDFCLVAKTTWCVFVLFVHFS